MKNLKYLLFLTILGSLFFSCKKDLEITTVTLTCVMPEGFKDAALSSIVLSAKNITTGHTTKHSLDMNSSEVYQFELYEGLYNFALEAKINSSVGGIIQTTTLRGYKESLNITGNQADVSVDLFLSKGSGDFVIAEIFFTGTLTPEGKQYLGDAYFRIFNNSDDTLYADGLVIVETKFLSSKKYNYNPDIMSSAIAADAIYRVPGSGTDHPVGPGKSILICDNAINHQNANVNSFDLRTADFEWYDVSSSPSTTDIDNPSVPNMEKIYCYTLSIWVPHNQGLNSYALGRLEVDKESYLRDYTYHYSYDLVSNAGTFPMTGNCYRFPNDWVIDAVNLSIESEFQWILTDPSLDMGWSYCAKISSDKDRYGKCVRRKTESTTTDGRKKLKDTNNSTEDFEPAQTANPFYFD